jgi:hypothetical protein
MALVSVGAFPGEFFPSSLRMVRVLKLMHMIKSLRRIVDSLTQSIVPVINSMVVVAIVTSVYCVVGVQLYGQQASAGNPSTTSHLWKISTSCLCQSVSLCGCLPSKTDTN